MSYAIVYSSNTGNTKMLAEAIKAELPAEECIYFGEPCEAATRADLIYIGFWTDKGSCDKKTAEFLKALTNRDIFLFGTAGFGEEKSYFDSVLKRTSENVNETVHIIGSFMCQGKMPLSVRSRYEKMLSGPVKIPNIEAMIKNFDKALSHPDQNDIEELKASLKAVK